MAKGKKTGGRKAGTPNKISLRLDERLSSMNDGRGFDPLQTLNELVEAVFVDRPDVVARICLGVLEYQYPKRRAVEHSGEINNPFLDKTIEELEALVREKLDKK